MMEPLENEITEFAIGKYIFNTKTQILKLCGDDERRLTTTEAHLLRLLALSLNQVVDRSFALKTIWKEDSYFKSRSMDVYIAKLRQYLRDDQSVKIVNKHGKGFKLTVNQI